MDAKNIKNRRLMESNDLELTPEVCNNILQMIKSNDQSNLVVVEETIKNIDVAKNLPYLLIMFKESNIEVRKTVFMNTIKDKLNQCCKTVKIEDNPRALTYNALYTEIKSHKDVSPESMNYFLDRFSDSLSDVMISWGFTFMEDFKLKLTPRQ